MASAHANCWARHLGNCSHKISSEHIISKSILGPDASFEVDRNGGVPVRLGKSSFTGNMLCAAHNSQLSRVDDEALKLYKGLEAIYTRGKATQVEVNIDVCRFEAWLTKTLINSVVSGFSDIARSSPRRQAPIEKRLIDIAFGKRRFANGGGAYIVSRVEPPDNWGAKYHFAPILADGRFVCGMIFKFCALWFVLWASDIPLGESVKQLKYIKGFDIAPLVGKTEVIVNDLVAGVIHYE